MVHPESSFFLGESGSKFGRENKINIGQTNIINNKSLLSSVMTISSRLLKGHCGHDQSRLSTGHGISVLV